MVHVAVVGAGIIGAALADALVRRGATVTVIDASEPGSGTSGSSLAWLNANQKLPRDYHDFSVRAMAEWRSLGDHSWYAPTGSLATGAGDRLDRLREWGYPVEELTTARAAELEPALSVAATAFFPSEAFVYGNEAVEALLRRASVRPLVTGGDVAFDVRGSRVSAVRLPDGARLRADLYVSCAGARTPALLEPVGVTVPLDAGPAAPCLVTRAYGTVPVRRVVNTPSLSLRPVRNGVQLEAGDLDTSPDGVATLLDRARELIRGFTPASTRHRVCVRPLPADGHPIADRLPGLDNAYVTVTHSGMTLGPLLGRLVATELVDATVLDDLKPYRLSRF
ncbi:FAD-binding oxidoreductase [Actinoplanes sp. LDG1-06]|uniref:FAD-binding oxidoreductase n=1 Tax=Paractinoplanes ovalisporus TaxID=2810368 RepID=A0ABS2AK97_9ACTN|nr:FAD-binding oxidoreductase [Actinoplanes ovalisporus]MBM2620279.1 FAD-binding oxidoreductase [Actinoplanes ovalisporus]